jgi:hypothetical protein
VRCWRFWRVIANLRFVGDPIYQSPSPWPSLWEAPVRQSNHDSNREWSATLSGAWEWRGFRPVNRALSELDLLEEARSLARGLSVDPPDGVMVEDDVYLVLPKIRHSLKLRRGCLEMKALIEHRPGGFARWQDKHVFSFPLQGERLALLWKFLPGRLAAPRTVLHSPSELVSIMRQAAWPAWSDSSNLALVPVHKRRVRLEVGSVRLELAHLDLAGRISLHSHCVDGYDLESVRALVRRGDMRRDNRTMSYLGLLHEALWWLPGFCQDDLDWQEEPNRELRAVS